MKEDIIVLKFGGTSVGDLARIRRVAKRAMALQESGARVVAVVSAMAGETNRLLGLATQLTQGFETGAASRERDALAATGEQVVAALTALAIQTSGGAARSLQGHQARILTNSHFGDAEILDVQTAAIRAAFERGEIPVVTGFQGVDQNGNVTTLGRGGSDTTAVVLAASLRATACEIFTDVDGVYDADPRHFPAARKFAHVSYEAMDALAACGARVLHDKCIRLAARHGVRVLVRSTFTDAPGTWVGAAPRRYPDAVTWGEIDRQNPVNLRNNA